MTTDKQKVIESIKQAIDKFDHEIQVCHLCILTLRSQLREIERTEILGDKLKKYYLGEQFKEDIKNE